MSGDSYSPAFDFAIRSSTEPPGYTWVDATHLVGQADMDADGWVNDAEGWAWEPGTAPKEVDVIAYVGSPYLGPHAGTDPWFLTFDPEHPDPDNPDTAGWSCLSLQDLGGDEPWPVLCDVVGVLSPEVALTHDENGAVVALDVHGVEDPGLRREVLAAGAPLRVTFATDLIEAALDSESGAS